MHQKLNFPPRITTVNIHKVYNQSVLSEKSDNPREWANCLEISELDQSAIESKTNSNVLFSYPNSLACFNINVK